MKSTWLRSGTQYFIGEITDQQLLIPVGVYELGVSPSERLFLNHLADKFEFPYKVYGIEDKFIKRVPITYGETTQNLGILLNGTKGTGKSVTAKLIANELNLPIIVVSHKFDGLGQFLAQIQQEVVVVFDEYEKVYEDGNELLSVMDGMQDSAHRRVFILTTNSLYISQSMLSRPGRLRYRKTFDDLDIKVVEEILDDILLYPEYREDCLEAISTLKIITIDLIKAIVNEVNIHNESPKEFMDYLNVKDGGEDYEWKCDAFPVTHGGASTVPLFTHLVLDRAPTQLNPGMYLRTADSYENVAKVLEKIGPDIYEVGWGLSPIPADRVEMYDEDTLIERVEKGKKKYYVRGFGPRFKQEKAVVKIVEQTNTHYSFKGISQVF